VNNSSGLKRA